MVSDATLGVRKGSLTESPGKGFHQLYASLSVIFFSYPLYPCNPPRINFSAWYEACVSSSQGLAEKMGSINVVLDGVPCCGDQEPDKGVKFNGT